MSKKSEDKQPLVTVLIATKNRTDCLKRLVSSVKQQDYNNIEIVIGDDGSNTPVELVGDNIKILRNDVSKGACFTRNRLLEISEGDFILILDDDTELVDRSALSRAINLANTFHDIGVVAFHQTFPDGTSHGTQPAQVKHLSYIVTPAFYACLVRAEAISNLSVPFIEEFGYYYEETEFALRLLDAGYKCIYDPSLKIIHYHDERGRDWKKIRRLWARNAILSHCLRYPKEFVFASIVATLFTFLKMKNEQNKRDILGFFWIITSIFAHQAFIFKNRNPVDKKTLTLFKQLNRNPVAVEV